MALASQTASVRRIARIMGPYQRLEYQRWFPLLRWGLIAMMAVMVIYASLLTTMGGTRLLKVAAIPIGVLLATVLWMLPDADQGRRTGVVPRAFMPVLLAFLAGIVIWPSYIAIVIPGLPWLTPPRMILAVMIVVALLHYPQHSSTRGTMVEILGYDRVAIMLVGIYEAINILVLPLGPSISDTISYYLLQQVMALTAVVVAAALLNNPDNILRITRVITLGFIFTMVVGVLENYMQSPPWANYIPSFMEIDENFLQVFLSPQARVGDNRYRIRSTFPVVLYYSQYLCLVIPLLLHAVYRARGKALLPALALVPLLLHTVWFANSRSAMLGLLIPLFIFAGMQLFKLFRGNGKRDSLKPGVVMAVILLLIGMMGGVLATSHRAQMYTLGGGQHAASDEARDQQWANAWRQLRSNPIGIGAGNSLAKVGIPKVGRDNLILDSLYINVLVDTGYLGFVTFFGFFLWVAWLGIKIFVRAVSIWEEQAGAMAIGLISFVVASYVISNTDSLYLAYLFAGMIIAIKRLQDQRLAEEARLAAAPAPSTALARRRA